MTTTALPRIFQVSLATASLSFLLPLSINQTSQLVVLKGLEVKTNIHNPARIAFDELFENSQTINSDNEISPAKHQVRLNETARRPIKKLKELFAKNLYLEPMKIDRRDLEEIHLPEPIEIAEGRRAIEFAPQELTIAQRNRLFEAQGRSQVLNQDWSVEEHQQAEDSLTIDSPYISKKANAVVGTATPNNPGSGSPARPSVPETGTFAAASNKAKSNAFLIKGSLRLDGVGMGPDRHIQIYRYDEGRRKEKGNIDYKTATFDIMVKEAIGILRAEIVDDKGHVIASGSYRLSPMDTSRKITLSMANQDQFAVNLYAFDRNPEMLAGTKSTSYRGIRANVSFPTFTLDAKTDDLGTHQITNVANKSWSLVETEADKTFPGVYLTSSGADSNLPVFSENLGKALYQIARNAQPYTVGDTTESVVWGQILIDGKPARGIQVEVEYFEQYKPVYFTNWFTQWIPDSKMTYTSENGYFAIVDLPEGFHSLIAKRKGKYIGHVNVQVMSQKISPVTISASIKSEPVDLKVYDAFTGVAVTANLEMQSLSEPIKVNGSGLVYLPNLRRLSLNQVTPLDSRYVSGFYQYSDDDEKIHIPLILSAWLQSIKSFSGLTETPETGTIVGFGMNSEYDAYLSSEAEYSRANIVFFDSQGNVQNHGVAGGGFIMYNVPQGTLSAVVVDRQSDRISGKVVPMDGGSTHILQFDF